MEELVLGRLVKLSPLGRIAMSGRDDLTPVGKIIQVRKGVEFPYKVRGLTLLEDTNFIGEELIGLPEVEFKLEDYV